MSHWSRLEPKSKCLLNFCSEIQGFSNSSFHGTIPRVRQLLQLQEFDHPFHQGLSHGRHLFPGVYSPQNNITHCGKMDEPCFSNRLLTKEQEDLESKFALESHHVLMLLRAPIRIHGSRAEIEEVGEVLDKLEQIVKDQEDEIKQQQQKIHRVQQSHECFKLHLAAVKEPWETTLTRDEELGVERCSSPCEIDNSDEPREPEKPRRPCKTCHRPSPDPLCGICYQKMYQDIGTYYEEMTTEILEGLDDFIWKKTLHDIAIAPAMYRDMLTSSPFLYQSILTAYPSVRNLATTKPDRSRLVEEPARLEGEGYRSSAEKEAIENDYNTTVLSKLELQEDQDKDLTNFAGGKSAEEFHEVGRVQAGHEVPHSWDESRQSGLREAGEAPIMSSERLECLLEAELNEKEEF